MDEDITDCFLAFCRRQVELVQDLEFPAACHRMKATPDGQYLFATGIHAPRLRVYELSQLSMKFERHFDAEIVDFQVLMFVTCSVY
jgi:ribosome biogenesis protein ENP2